MEAAARIRLVNGSLDGIEVEDAHGAEILWVYKNMYDQVRAIRADGLPRTPTLSAYIVMPGRHEPCTASPRDARCVHEACRGEIPKCQILASH
jgi:hypothetical protein